MDIDKNYPLRYIPIACYALGLYYYGCTKPHKTIEVEADSMGIALCMGYTILQPDITERVCHIATAPNPRYLRWRKNYRTSKVYYG